MDSQEGEASARTLYFEGGFYVQTVDSQVVD